VRFGAARFPLVALTRPRVTFFTGSDLPRRVAVLRRAGAVLRLSRPSRAGHQRIHMHRRLLSSAPPRNQCKVLLRYGLIPERAAVPFSGIVAWPAAGSVPGVGIIAPPLAGRPGPRYLQPTVPRRFSRDCAHRKRFQESACRRGSPRGRPSARNLVRKRGIRKARERGYSRGDRDVARQTNFSFLALKRMN